jgi:hypothetical protein
VSGATDGGSGRGGTGGSGATGGGGAGNDGGAGADGGCSTSDDCALDHADATCRSGRCEIAACTDGFFDCDDLGDNGCEVDAQSDALHCGDCDIDCNAALANVDAARCASGSCQVVTCAAGFASCDGDEATGCETSILTTSDCGGCASGPDHEVCTGLSHVTGSSCAAGSCQVDACENGFADCDAIAGNGCEQDTSAAGSCDPNLKRITIDPSFVDAALSDFPVLVRIAGDADLTTSRADGLDLYFATDGGPAGGPTALAFQIASWAASSGDLIAWVRVPTVSDAAGTVFYLHYGDGADYSSTNPQAAVWDADFESVHHFDGDSVLDATANATDGTNQGSSADPAGQILGARAFSPSDYVDVGTGVLPDEPDYTLSAWVKVTRAGGDADCKYVMDASRSSPPYEGSALGVRRSTGAICAYVNGAWRFSAGDFAADGAWSFVAARYSIRSSGGVLETSVGGQPFEPVYSGDTRDAANLSTSPFQVGRWSGGMSYYFDGSIDELRVSSTARSNAWIRAEYENQRAGSTFLSITDP